MSSLHITVSITAVIVMYQQLPENSDAFVTLQQAYACARGTGVRLQILVYDNTPYKQTVPSLPEGVLYVAAQRNEGLATAYNHAAALGEIHGSQWLLTLDQDTKLPRNFLEHMVAIALEVEQTPVVAAIVPHILGDGRLLSPYCFKAGALPSWYRLGFYGCPARDVFAFNSGALVRISTLRQVGGYDPWFWLDNSDTLLFRQLHRHGKRVFVAGEIKVQHQFSMLDLKNRTSIQRYHNVLLAESAFWDLEMSTLAGLERTARLSVRAAKQVKRRDTVLLPITLEFLKRRLFWSRQKRLRHWRTETLKLFPGLPARMAFVPPGTGAEKNLRSRISVCMATYNNEPFIEVQVRSILQQLRPGDEIVIVDDASTDNTVSVIDSLQSPFIHLIRHSQNGGVVATFEEALRNATGDILFLADGDDIWSPDKVERFLEVFEQSPQITLVTSRVAFIDQDGRPIESTMYSNRKVFHSGFWHNLLRNHFQGSAMALRASLLGTVLPFPKGVDFLHDHWIGMRNALHGSNTAICLEKPLLFYRRHATNLSGRKPRGGQLKVRLQLLWAHGIAALRPE